jgi:hypothetical protein
VGVEYYVISANSVSMYVLDKGSVFFLSHLVFIT